MKLCRSCGIERELDFFHKRKASKDGLSALCKSCQRRYDKARANNPKRIASRLNYAKTDAGIEAAKKAKRNWAARNKQKIHKTNKTYREKYPNKYRAHGKVAYEVRVGNLVPEPCEMCGSEERQHAHHDDYSQPLNVRWLCPKCHRQWHKENGEAKNP